MDNRFSRHQLINGWEQEKLTKATVIIVGVGALGNEVCRILGMAGVGNLVICDPDFVSESNLSRCSLFSNKDIGIAKVNAVAKNLIALAPNTFVDCRKGRFIDSIGLAEIKRANLVISCVDNYRTRIELSARCNLVKKAYIDGGTQPWGGEVRLFWDYNEACISCTNILSLNEVDEVPWSCSSSDNTTQSFTGTSILMTSIVGSWISNFAVRNILNLKNPSGTLRINSENGFMKYVKLNKREDCLFHSPIEGYIEKTSLNRESTIEELMSILPPKASPMLWVSAPLKYYCTDCKHEATFKNNLSNCQVCCSEQLIIQNEYEIRQFDKYIKLSDLGIPQSEIIPYRIDIPHRTDAIIKYVEII